MSSVSDGSYTENETKTTQCDPNVIFEKKKIEWIFFQPIKLSISQTPDEDNLRTYASLDESTTEAKDIEYENLKPARGYVNASP